MREARMKLKEEEAYYHLYNRVAGPKDYFPFQDEHKEKAFQILAQLSEYFLVETLSATLLGNHFHVAAWAPKDPPPLEEAAKRYNAYQELMGRKKRIHIDNAKQAKKCEKYAKDMIDISEFMRSFQQQFSVWFNRVTERRGGLWAGRFKNTILDAECSVWTCVQYIELNAVRAGMVEEAADYRWCTYGRFCGSGKHPFAKNFHHHMRRTLGEYALNWSDEQLMGEFRSRMAKRVAFERDPQINEKELDAQGEEARRPDSMPLHLLRRVRHWTDGGIIGSKLFVMDTLAKFRPPEYAKKKRLSRGCIGDTVLYSFRRLRLSTE
jgi:putative transposase